jgi:hypothetical protein
MTKNIFISYIFKGILAIIGLIIILFVLQYLGWVNFNYFAIKYAETQNTIYRHNPAFTEGMEMQLSEMQQQYIMTKTSSGRAALRGMIVHEFRDYNVNTLPPNLRKFYNFVLNKYNIDLTKGESK